MKTLTSSAKPKQRPDARIRARGFGISLLGMLVLLLLTSPVQAASTEAVTQTFSFSPTDWNDSVDLPLFDGSLGTLTAIVFDLDATVGGAMSYENQDGSSQTITLNLASELAVAAPSGLIGFTEMVAITPAIQIIELASAYDGNLDFDGTSGSTFSGLSESDNNTTTYNSSNPLWEFSLKDYFTTDTPGTEVALPVSAIAQSSGTGSGNLSLNFQTSAGGELTVSYFYAPVPEPSTFALIASAMLLLVRRRR